MLFIYPLINLSTPAKGPQKTNIAQKIYVTYLDHKYS